MNSNQKNQVNTTEHSNKFDESLKKNERIALYRINDTAKNSEKVYKFLRTLTRMVGGVDISSSLTLYSPFFRIEKGILYYYPNYLRKEQNDEVISNEPYQHSHLDVNATKKEKFVQILSEMDVNFLSALDNTETPVTAKQVQDTIKKLISQTIQQEGEFIKRKNKILPAGSENMIAILRRQSKICSSLLEEERTNDAKNKDKAMKKTYILSAMRNIFYAINPAWADRITLDESNKVIIAPDCISYCSLVINDVIKDINTYGYIRFRKLFDALDITTRENPFPKINTQQELLSFMYAITYSEPYFGNGDRKSEIDTAKDHLGIFRNSLLTRLFTKNLVHREYIDKVYNEVIKIVDQTNKEERKKNPRFFIECRKKSEFSVDAKHVNGKDTFWDALGIRIIINEDILNPLSEDASNIMLEVLSKIKKIKKLVFATHQYDPKFMKDKIGKDDLTNHINEFCKKHNNIGNIEARKKETSFTGQIPLVSQVDNDALAKDKEIGSLFNDNKIDITHLSTITDFLTKKRNTGGFGTYEDRKIVTSYNYKDTTPSQMAGIETQLVGSNHANDSNMSNHTYVLDPMKYIFAQLRSTSNIQYGNALSLILSGINKFVKEYYDIQRERPEFYKKSQEKNISTYKIGDKEFNFNELINGEPNETIPKKQIMAKTILMELIKEGRLHMGFFYNDLQKLNIYNKKDLEKNKPNMHIIENFIPPHNEERNTNNAEHNGLRLKDRRLGGVLDKGAMTGDFDNLIPTGTSNNYIAVKNHVLAFIQRKMQEYPSNKPST